jgi:DNA-directed RNA polymerase specialized sigma24 family protein
MAAPRRAASRHCRLLHFVSALRVRPASSGAAWFAPSPAPPSRPEGPRRSETVASIDVEKLRQALEALPQLEQDVFRLSGI